MENESSWSKEYKSEYEFQEMLEIEPEMEALLVKLKEKIESGYYSCLLSDEVGGRIPTLILSSVMKKVYSLVNPDRVKLKTLFIPAGYRDNPSRSRRSVSRQKIISAAGKHIDENEKVLLVTQYLRSGRSIGDLMNLLENIGVRADIAAMESVMDEDTLGYVTDLKYEKQNGRPIIYVGAKKEESDPSIDNDSVRNAVGVRKNPAGFIEPDPNASIDEMSKLRTDIEHMADKLFNKLWN